LDFLAGVTQATELRAEEVIAALTAKIPAESQSHENAQKKNDLCAEFWN
jgi:hypothetical protein